MWDPCPVAVSLLVHQTKSRSCSYRLCIMGSLVISSGLACADCSGVGCLDETVTHLPTVPHMMAFTHIPAGARRHNEFASHQSFCSFFSFSSALALCTNAGVASSAYCFLWGICHFRKVLFILI